MPSTRSRPRGRLRRLLARLLAGAALAAVPGFAAAGRPVPAAAGGVVDLLYHSDVGGKIEDCGCRANPLGGLARRATLLDTVLNEGSPVLLVDAGGLFGPRDPAAREQTRFLCQVTGTFGYDAIGVDQADLNYGLAFLREMMARHGLPFTSANLRDRATGATLLPPYLLVKKGALTFAVCSVLDPARPFLTMTVPNETFRVDDPAATLRALLPELRRQAQVVVLLANLDVVGTELLLKAVPGIDLAVVGHTQRLLPTARPVAGALLVACGYEGRSLGRLTARFDAGGRLQESSVVVTELGPEVAPDPVVREQVARFKAHASPQPAAAPGAGGGR